MVRKTHPTGQSHVPEYRRANTKGGTYFFTVNTFRRQTLLTEERIRRALREGIELTRINYPFQIDAWVLLPDHLHCIWTLPPDDADFSSRWAFIKRHVSKCCGKEFGVQEGLSASRQKRKETGLWQRRFWEHQIQDEIDFMRHVDYIHWNPVKHGHVARAVDWPHSTFHRFVKMDIYTAEWGGDGVAEMRGAGFGEQA